MTDHSPISGKPDMETYLHRIGRTGRFGKKGIAINFVDSADTLRMVKDIQVSLKGIVNNCSFKSFIHFTAAPILYGSWVLVAFYLIHTNNNILFPQNYFNKEIMKLNTDDTDEIEGITK